jgi:16S rRNA (cytosine1402-N4)-methyltransferase
LTTIHIPVLVNEVIKFLAPKEGGVYVDATIGLGGHALAICNEIGKTGTLIGIDQDESALVIAREKLAAVKSKVILVHNNYRNLNTILSERGYPKVDGMLFDLGASSMQFDDATRGFSFQQPGPLDMRMDTSRGITASDWINTVSEKELSKVLWEYGEERYANRIARTIVKERLIIPIKITEQLANVVLKAIVGTPYRRQNKIHPATRTMQAIRIYINQELEGLDQVLEHFIERLSIGGKAVFISFHSLEDRRVKRQMKRLKGECVCGGQGQLLCSCPRVEQVKILTPKPVQPGETEIAANPRSRSAKLRAIEKIAEP